jgi:PAS domain S-box-containing protein
MLAVVDTSSGRLMDVNPAFAASLGYRVSDLVDRLLLELVHPDDSGDARAALARLAGEAGAPPAEHRVAHADGSWRMLSWRAAPAERPGLAHLAAVDITRDRQRRLQFAASISHDLRAPLRAIDGFAGLLIQDAEDAGLPDATQRYLGFMRDAAAELDALLEGVVDVVRSGAAPLRPEHVDVVGLAAGAAGARVPDEVEVVIGALPPCTADPRLLRHVLEHLFDNAVKAGARRIELAHEDGAYVVRDDGIGFDGVRADRAFALFGRLHDRERFPGGGAGLAVVARIVERHGGRLHAVSSPGEGAAISFTLPR